MNSSGKAPEAFKNQFHPKEIVKLTCDNQIFIFENEKKSFLLMFYSLAQYSIEYLKELLTILCSSFKRGAKSARKSVKKTINTILIISIYNMLLKIFVNKYLVFTKHK